jgi:hypothetical protein
LELTYGVNGWHPHYHVLYFLSGIAVTSLAWVDSLADRLRSAWMGAVASMGNAADWRYAVDVRIAQSDVTDYIAKFGRPPRWTIFHEVAKSQTKKAGMSGATPLEMLAASVDDSGAARRWLEYAVNCKGQRQLFWSRGLRALLGLGDEQSDQQVASEVTATAILLGSLYREQWQYIVNNDLRAELVLLVGRGDIGLLESTLNEWGVYDVSIK